MKSYRRFRQLASLGLVLGGTILLVYGLFFHMTVVSSAEDAEANVLTRREPVLIYDVTIGQGRPTVEAEADVEVAKEDDASGAEMEKPKAAPKKEAPKACPT